MSIAMSIIAGFIAWSCLGLLTIERIEELRLGPAIAAAR